MPGEVRDGQGGPGEGCGLWALNSRFWILGSVLWALVFGLWALVLDCGSRLWALGFGLWLWFWAPESGV